jgi:hypothetical protein
MVRVTKDLRLPPQGGLPPTDARGSAVVEIACDESGFSGTNLLEPATPVFTHASVDLRVDEAAALIRTLQSDVPWSLDEVKSGRFLRRPQADDAVECLLAAVSGRAHVHVVDKEYFLVTRIVDLFLAEPSYAAGTRLTGEQRPAALSLYRAGRAGGREWDVFLETFVDLVRVKRGRRPDHRVVQRFFAARDSLARLGLGPEAGAVLDRLSRTRVRAILTRLARDDRSIPPPLEPMLPALAETVLFWSRGGRQVQVVHDEQSALTAGRLRRLQEALAHGAQPSGADAPETGRSPVTVSPLAGLVTVDSRDDPRIQVADLLAAVARRSRNNGYGRLLQPFISPTSLWDPKE